MSDGYYDPKPIELIETLASTLFLTKATASGFPEPFVILPHARRFMDKLFGTKRADGTRQYRKAYWSTARKNAKTQYAALMGLSLLLFDAESKPEIYVAATEANQAALTFEAVRDMVRSNPELEERLEIVEYKRLVMNPRNGGILQAVSSTGAARHGSNPSTVIFDELHVWGKELQGLYDALTTGSVARRQPLTIMITTAGSDELSICGREYAYAKKVLDGTVIDRSYFAEIHELPKEADWTDESLWHLPNPALGTIVKPEHLRQGLADALSSPHKQNTFRRMHLNQWTESDSSWIPLHIWDKNAAPVDEQQLIGVPCYGGLDLAAQADLTAFVLVWEIGGYFHVKPWFFIGEEGIAERSRRDGVRYDLWAEQGLIELTPGRATDYLYVTDRIRELSRQFDIQAIAFDRAGAGDVSTRLQNDGMTVIEWQQNIMGMSAPAKLLERLAIEKKIRHSGHLVLRWNVDCTSIHVDSNGNIKPVHPDRYRQSKRNDGVIALVMALGAWQRKPEPEWRSIYEDPATAVM